MEKSIHFMSFSKEIFPTYFENNRNSVESWVRELKNIKHFLSVEHGLKSDKSVSAFLKLCFHLC